MACGSELVLKALRGFQFTIVSNLPKLPGNAHSCGGSCHEREPAARSNACFSSALGYRNSACVCQESSQGFPVEATLEELCCLLALSVGSSLIIPSSFLWPFPSAQWEGREKPKFAHHEATSPSQALPGQQVTQSESEVPETSY